MNAKEVIDNGTLVSKSQHSGMKVYSYKGYLWAIFSDRKFAYAWGPVQPPRT